MQAVNQADLYAVLRDRHRQFAARARCAADSGFHASLAARYETLAQEAHAFGRGVTGVEPPTF